MGPVTLGKAGPPKRLDAVIGVGEAYYGDRWDPRGIGSGDVSSKSNSHLGSSGEQNA